RDAHPGVIGNWRIDMHRVHVRIFEQRIEIRVTRFHAEIVADRIKLLLIALTNGVTIRVGMFLPERNELRTKTEADNGDVEFLAHSKFALINQGTGRDDEQSRRAGQYLPSIRPVFSEVGNGARISSLRRSAVNN